MRSAKQKHTKRVVVRVLLTAACIVVAPLVYQRIARFVTSDPFVGLYKRKSEIIDDDIGIRMNGVELRDYRGGKLLSTAYANRVDIQKDRETATLYGVKDGTYNGEKGPIHYSAQKALWFFRIKQVHVSGGVKVRNKDFNLTAN